MLEGRRMEGKLKCIFLSVYEKNDVLWQLTAFQIFYEFSFPFFGTERSVYDEESDSRSYYCKFQSQNYLHHKMESITILLFLTFHFQNYYLFKITYLVTKNMFIHFQYSIISFFSMLKKKRIQQSRQHKFQGSFLPTPLSKLEQLAHLQRQLINYLGPKNINVDMDCDLFSRLEELYLKYLQAKQLGLQVLNKIIDFIGEADAPARIRILYLLAHQLYLAGKNPMSVLQEASSANLCLKNKILTGYNCGIILAQLTACPRLVEATLGSIIVALETEVKFTAKRSRQLRASRSRNSPESLKSVYVGARINSKSKLRSGDYSKFQLLNLKKCLYEAYFTGARRLHSSAKRRYYTECQEELGRKMVRQYPGINIQQKINLIMEGYTISKKFTSIIKKEDNQVNKLIKQNISFRQSSPFRQTAPQSVWIKSKRQSSHQLWNKSTEFQDINNISRRGNQDTDKNNLQKKQMNFKIRIQSHHNKEIKQQSSSRLSQSLRVNKSMKNVHRHIQINKQNKNTKYITLKFDRLHNKNESKIDIRKKIIKGSVQWEEKISNNALQSVVNVIYSPVNITKKPGENEQIVDIGIQTQIKEQRCQSIKLKEDDGDILVSEMLIQQSENFDKRIDNMLKEGVQFISSFRYINNNKINRASQASSYLEDKTYDKIQAQKVHIEEFPYKQLSSDTNQIITMIEQPYSVTPINFDESKSQKIQKKVFLNIKKQSDQSLANSFENEINRKETQSRNECSKVQQQLYIDDIKSSVCSSQQSIQYKIIINNQEGDVVIEDDGKVFITPVLNKYFEDLIHNIIEGETQIYINQLQDKNKVSQQSPYINKDENKNYAKKEKVTTEQINESIVEIIGIKQSIVQNPDIKKIESKTKSITKIRKAESIEINSHITSENKNILTKKILSKQITNSYISLLYEDVITSFNKKNNHKNVENIAKSKPDVTKKVTISSKERRTSLGGVIIEKINTPQRVQIIHQCQDNSFDEKDLSSEYPSERNRKGSKDSNPNTPFSRSDEEKKSLKSNFTCSRFACSKIQQKQSSSGQISQLNIIQQLIRTIDGQIKSSDLLSQDGTSMRKFRSRAQSCVQSEQGSNSNFNDSKSPSKKRQNSQLNSSGQQMENSILINQNIIKINHWMQPIICITSCKASFKIHNPRNNGQEAEKTKKIPEQLALSVDLLANILTRQYNKFLNKFPSIQIEWRYVIEQFFIIDIIPDVITLFNLDLFEPNLQSPFSAIFEYLINQKQFSITFNPYIIKSHTISLEMNKSLSQIIENIKPDKLIIRDGQLIFINIWTIVGQKSIKLRDKYENTTVNCTFKIYQCFIQNSFHYKIQGKAGQVMEFNNIDYKLRQKVLSNIETIIGYAIKLINKKIVFSNQNISQLIHLL